LRDERGGENHSSSDKILKAKKGSKFYEKPQQEEKKSFNISYSKGCYLPLRLLTL
jgi:hypothetical protein